MAPGLMQRETAGRMDAGEELYFAQQHELQKSEIYDIIYEELKGRQHFPVSFDGGDWVDTISYFVRDRYGEAALGLGFPRVGITMQKKYSTVQPLTVSWGHTFQEIRHAKHVGINLDDSEAQVARRAVAELEDRLIYLGDPSAGLMGAFTHPNFSVMVGDVQLYAPTTANSRIVDEFNRFLDSPRILSKGIERFNTVLMPERLYAKLESTPYSDNAPTLTVLDIIRNGHKGIDFDWCNWCNGAGADGEDIMFGYNKSSRNMEVSIPHPFEIFPPRLEAKQTYVTEAHERFGGLIVRFAIGMLYEIAPTP